MNPHQYQRTYLFGPNAAHTLCVVMSTPEDERACLVEYPSTCPACKHWHCPCFSAHALAKTVSHVPWTWKHFISSSNDTAMEYAERCYKPCFLDDAHWVAMAWWLFPATNTLHNRESVHGCSTAAHPDSAGTRSEFSQWKQGDDPEKSATCSTSSHKSEQLKTTKHSLDKHLWNLVKLVASYQYLLPGVVCFSCIQFHGEGRRHHPSGWDAAATTKGMVPWCSDFRVLLSFFSGTDSETRAVDQVDHCSWLEFLPLSFLRIVWDYHGTCEVLVTGRV